MNRQAVRLVAIDDDPACLELVSAALDREGLAILTSDNSEEGLELVIQERPQIVLLDLFMPKMGGMELLDRFMEIDPGMEVVLMTAHYSTESAVEAIRKGASDYMNKPLSIERLRERVDKLLMEARQRQRTLQLDVELLQAYRFEGIVGRSPLMLEVFARIRRVAPHFQSVLVTGPTGTGKELVARALHRLGPGPETPLVICNCSAIVETLFESELFGHVKGSFTGAVKDKVGLFEYAHGGTLFLDEIGDMPLSTQVKLLRVLEHQQVQKVGSHSPQKVDVRVIAATNRDLATLIAKNQFRDDLFYRLSMVEIKLPTLADRKEDLPLLQQYFLGKFATQYNKPIQGASRRAQTALARHAWPGNVRELENVLGSACMMAEGEFIDIRDLPEALRTQSSGRSIEEEGWLPLSDQQKQYAARVLEHVGGNKVRAAQILGISRATLYRLLSKDPPQRIPGRNPSEKRR